MDSHTKEYPGLGLPRHRELIPQAVRVKRPYSILRDYMFQEELVAQIWDSYDAAIEAEMFDLADQLSIQLDSFVRELREMQYAAEEHANARAGAGVLGEAIAGF